MQLPDLIADLRTDLTDNEKALFTDQTEQQRELLLLLARINGCQVMRSATANAFSFASGDKRVDKTSQPEHWAKLEADLLAEYRQRIALMKPVSAANPDNYIITPAGLAPVIYEQGSLLEEI